MELNGWSSSQMLEWYGGSARGARARRSYDRIMNGCPGLHGARARSPMRARGGAGAAAAGAAGYARREAEPGDRRVVRLCLTAAGRAALERADAAYASWLGPLLGATGDMAGVLEAFRDLDAAMDERRRARIGVA